MSRFSRTDRRGCGHGKVVQGAVLAAALFASGVAGADPEAIHFHYEAPAGCPSAGEMVSSSVEMGGTFVDALPGAPGRAFDVVIRPTASGFAGSLAVQSRAGDSRVRTVLCRTCEAVARALGLFMALALEQPDGPERAEVPEPPLPEVEAGRVHTEAFEKADTSFGLAVAASWGNLQWAPTGATLLGVAPPLGATRFGLVAAFSSDSIADSKGSLEAIVAQGYSGRLGALASWGAPWSESVVGLELEAGVRAGSEQGTQWSAARLTTNCQELGMSPYSPGVQQATDNCLGPGTQKHWVFASPYVGGTLFLQALPSRPVHPLAGLTLLWTGDYNGDSSTRAYFSLGFGGRL